jgi:[ribosomal protein S18]-alanine N-acetyltransferase
MYGMKYQLEIRDYRPSDFEDVMKLWQMTDMGGEERRDNNEVIMRTISNGGKLIIMEKNYMIIGTSWITHDCRRSYLHHFGIHPDEQGKGYGNILMEETMKYFKEKTYQVKLEVHKDNFKAINLYKKYGFIDFPDYELMMNRTLKP